MKKLLSLLALTVCCIVGASAQGTGDYTSYIVNASLTGTGGFDATGTKGIDGSGIVKAGNNAQFDFCQTIENLPAGQYKLSAKAAYRYSGSEVDEAKAIDNGTPTKFATLYATVGEKTVSTPVKNRYDGASDTDYAKGEGSVTVNGKYVPNSSNAVKAWFEAGEYVNEVVFNLPEAGNVTIGIVKTAQPADGDYTVIGPWTLTRLGDAEKESEPEAVEPGTDMTKFIVNPSFESGDLTGWSVAGSSDDTGIRRNDNGTYTAAGCDGDYLFNTWWQGLAITQVISGLPNGKYELKALMTSDPGDHLYLLANGEHSAVFGSPSGKEVFVEQSMQFYVTNNTATIGAIGGNGDGTFNENGYYWYKADHFRLTYVGALPNVDDIEIPAGKMNNAAAEAIAAAKSANDVKALIEAVKKAKESIAAYEKAQAALEGMKNVMDKNNVYTEEAFEAYNAIYTTNLAAYNNGTLSDDDAKAIENPELRTNWQHDASVVVDDLLLSAWSIGGEKAKDYEKNLYINTWSGEGEGDGSNFLVPFYEYWTNDGSSLGETALTATMTGLEAGKYAVSAWVRVRMKNGAEAPATGITLQLNDGDAVDVCAGDQIGESQFYIDEFFAFGTVGEDGKLNIKFDVAADNNISWLSFKDVYVVELVPGPTRWDFTKWSDATVANLIADAAASMTTGWSDVEKKDGTAPTEVSKDNCFWLTTSETGVLTANDVEIEELKGLNFHNSGYNSARSIAIAVNYGVVDTSKDFGPYEGASYLWLGSKGKECFTIPGVKGGSVITMGVESHKVSDARGVQLIVDGATLTDPEGNEVTAPKAYTVQTWQVPDGSAKDVLVKNTNGCHLYFIEAMQETINATIGEEGWASFISDKSVAVPKGVKAFIMKDFKADGATLETIGLIPANTPVLLKGKAGDYQMALVTSSLSEAQGNMLLMGGVTVTDSNYGAIWVLAKLGEAVGFHKVAKGVTVPADKVYVNQTLSDPARTFIPLEGMLTGIESIDYAQTRTQHAVYSLSGQRVGKAFKGLVISNGKKYLNK